MDPTLIGIRLTSSALAPLIKRLFRPEGPGAGLVDRPVRLSSYVSVREKRVLTEADLRLLAGQLVDRALRAPGERPLPDGEGPAVVDALTRTLHALGDLALTDVQAVELGHAELARRLRAAAPAPLLSRDAGYFHERLLDTVCLHVLDFFTRRSVFVADTLVHQTRRQGELIAKVDELIGRIPRPDARDTAFEHRYLAHMARQHSTLTIYGIDLPPGSAKWPLDAAYVSLEVLERDPGPTGGPGSGRRPLALVPPPGRTPPTAPARLRTLPADQALGAHERVLLRGEAGSGKTTLVQWLAVRAAGPVPTAPLAYLRDRIPYVLPLRALSRHGGRLPAPRGFLAAAGSPLAGSQPEGWETRVLDSGRALVLVDGLDEVPEAERAEARDWLAGLISAYPGNRWLVTTRPAAVREDWLAEEGFSELTLSPMTAADVAGFIGRWHTAAATGRPEADADLAGLETRLRDAVRSKPDLGRLATNPLMCGLICALHRERRGFLPLGRHDLYAAALSMLLTRRDRERRVASVAELREEPQLQLLQRLAFWLIRNGRTEMPRHRAEALIAEALPAVREAQRAFGGGPAAYAHFLARSGLLREPVPGTVEFVHRTFQDYLGARAAVDEGGFGELAAHAHDDQWEDVIRMAVAQARPRERAELIRALLAGEGTRAALLAFACLEYAAELDPAVREEAERRAARLIPPADEQQAVRLAQAGPIILDLLPGPDEVGPVAARHVVTAAAHVPSERAVAFLSRFCSHEDREVLRVLLSAWDRFDTELYGREVIGRVADGDLPVTVASDEQLALLGELPVVFRQMTVGRSVSAEALRAHTPHHRLASLSLRETGGLTDLGFLRGQTGLESLELTGCPALRSLTGIEGLPVREVFLTAQAAPEDLEVLAALPRLRGLGLVLDRGSWSLGGLSPEASLEWLTLAARLTDGLAGVERHPRLKTAYFSGSSSPAAPEDWQRLAALPVLAEMELPAGSLRCAPDRLALPALRRLYLNHLLAEDPVLNRLPGLFPGLTDLYVVNGQTSEVLLPRSITVHRL
ncbi:NACHT domain-containing protein [Streptomyces bambusae]|uniref:NACHT domain-containing protein n=1 Tax=Streptomyces bambusae TaxID=1550616 RepID=UPI001CFFBE64|nr:NACHT domain-containing protein [Streptomyces bambusae]MCB5169920.1 NACHT domain-containing protein [Streptomyces bambusae]